jgi:hypothetical protein
MLLSLAATALASTAAAAAHAAAASDVQRPATSLPHVLRVLSVLQRHARQHSDARVLQQPRSTGVHACVVRRHRAMQRAIRVHRSVVLLSLAAAALAAAYPLASAALATPASTTAQTAASERAAAAITQASPTFV